MSINVDKGIIMKQPAIRWQDALPCGNGTLGALVYGVHMANIYARLGEGNNALKCLELICRSCAGPNFFIIHNDWKSQGITMFWGHRGHLPSQIHKHPQIHKSAL
jgi:hypothetical protein